MKLNFLISKSIRKWYNENQIDFISLFVSMKFDHTMEEHMTILQKTVDHSANYT